MTNLIHFSFSVLRTDGDKPAIRVQFKGECKTFSPEQISALVLSNMKDVAESLRKNQACFYYLGPGLSVSDVSQSSDSEGECATAMSSLEKTERRRFLFSR